MGPSLDVVEQKRLNEARERQTPWKKWGPYLSERQWGTVREDYSDDGNAWDYFTHDQARSRAYRWGEDGLGGLCDDQQRLCFALALWNERDPILKERSIRTHQQRREPRRGRQGVLLLHRQHAHPLVHEVSVQVPASGVSLSGLDPHQPGPIAGRARVRAAGYRRLRRGPLLRRVRGIREAESGRHSRSHQRAQPRARVGPPSRLADALVPKHLVLGRGPEEAGAARSGAWRHPRHAPRAWRVLARMRGCRGVAVHREREQRRPPLGPARPLALRQGRLPRLCGLGPPRGGQSREGRDQGGRALCARRAGRRQHHHSAASDGRTDRRCLRRLRRHRRPTGLPTRTSSTIGSRRRR